MVRERTRSSSWLLTKAAKAAHALGGFWGLSIKMSSSAQACLKFVQQHAQQGDAASVVAAIDQFAASHMMMNVGPHKGAIVEAEIRKKRPLVMVEAGGYMGYSAIRFAALQREVAGNQSSHYYSFEISSEFANTMRQMVAFAGLSDQVTVVVGAFHERLETTLKRKNVDIYFMDHDHTRYLRDAKLIINSGTLQSGSLLIADNVVFPGAPDYLEYVESSPQFTATRHSVKGGGRLALDDAVSVAMYLGW